MKVLLRALLLLSIMFVLIILLSIPYVQSLYPGKIVTAEAITPGTTAIIFGAGLNPDGTPREMLEARVVKGIELLQSRKVSKLLLTGDGSEATHDEPGAMKAYARNAGVAESDLLLDPAGFTTFDSCERARRIFAIKRAILVTQAFHLPRALYLCNNLGMDAVGLAASSTDGKAERLYAQREYLASVKAWIMINIPKLRPFFEK